MLRERIASQSEVIGAVVSGYSPCCGVPHLAADSLVLGAVLAAVAVALQRVPVNDDIESNDDDNNINDGNNNNNNNTYTTNNNNKINTNKINDSALRTGLLSSVQTWGTQGKGSVLAAKAVETQGKGSVSAAKAVGTQGKGGVVVYRGGRAEELDVAGLAPGRAPVKHKAKAMS